MMPMVWLYGVATMPLGRVVAVSDTPPLGVTVRLTGPLMVCGGLALSVRVTTRFAVPGVVGVPLMVQAFSERPSGRAPREIAHVYGAVPPVALMVPR